MIKKDKLLHLIAGATVALLGAIVAGWKLGIFSAVIVGGFKELWDKQGNGTPELADFLYTALGGIGGVCIWILM